MTGECLNIGVYTYDINSDKVYTKFLNKYDRVQAAFGSARDPIFEAIVADLKKIDSKQELDKTIWRSGSPYSSLQFTQPRASLGNAEELVEWAATTFLTE